MNTIVTQFLYAIFYSLKSFFSCLLPHCGDQKQQQQQRRRKKNTYRKQNKQSLTRPIDDSTCAKKTTSNNKNDFFPSAETNTFDCDFLSSKDPQNKRKKKCDCYEQT